MAKIRSVNEIILSLQDFYKLAQPDLDTKPGTVARDLFIEGPALPIGQLYDEMSAISDKSSFRVVVGSDLDKLAQNFQLTRRQATPAAGVALLTFSSINANININRGDVVIANNGFSFSVLNGVTVSASSTNFYRSIATKFRDQLDFVGISDLYAVQVSVVASSPGTAGRIDKFSLTRTSIPGVTNVTNINRFSGGSDQETDSSFRSRILASFSGSSVGTMLGYRSAALSVDGVLDVSIVEPGSPLMVRDGTIVKTYTDGSKEITSEGSGGKVDVVILGSNLIETTDTFIYLDKSNNNDPTDVRNTVILGQIEGDEKKTINKRRKDSILNGILPEQPANEILSVAGTSSGANFKAKTVDSLGRVSGNYELIKDTSSYEGSPFGFDSFKFISNKISLFTEDKIKGQLNGQDNLSFSDVTEIPNIQQNVNITNENSTVTFDRSIIQLLHTPATNVTRVFNFNTGERYNVVSQNFDNTGLYNTTGRIKISGSTLPSPSDTLQVDYSWIINFDAYSDYDGLYNTENLRPVDDSIDWGYGSMVHDEKILFSKDVGNNFFVGYSKLPISTIIYANQFVRADGKVTKVNSGTFINRLSIVISNLIDPVTSVDGVFLKNTNVNVYQTSEDTGSFSNLPNIVGIDLLNTLTIILPYDSPAKENDLVTIYVNSTNTFVNGNSNGFQITIPSNEIDTTEDQIELSVSYIANTNELFSSSTVSLPASKLGNGFFLTNNIGSANYSIANNYKRENQIVKKNFSNQILIDTFCSAAQFEIKQEDILSVIRLSDNQELWNIDNPGTIIIDENNMYQLVFSGMNTPVINDRTLLIYSPKDLRRVQPFTFSNKVIKTQFDVLDFDSTIKKHFVSLNLFTNETSLSFDIIDGETQAVLSSFTDGNLIATTTGATLGTGVSLVTNNNLLFNKVKISQSTNNNGVYDIVSYDSSTNIMTLSNSLNLLNNQQVSVIRIEDGKELWNGNCSIDSINNRLLLTEALVGDIGDNVYVMFYTFKNLTQMPTRVIATTIDQVINPGTITISGNTLSKAVDIIFTSTSSTLKLNISEAIRKALGLSSNVSLPSNIKLAKILKLEKVVTASPTNNEVLKVLHEYDVKNAALKDNVYFSDDVLLDTSLSTFEMRLPTSLGNTQNDEIKNLPSLGDKFRISFYYIVDGDSENLVYTKNGTLYTNKKFAIIDKIFISSGFKTSQSTKFTATSFTQPSLGARYSVSYDYLAPKQNERITVTYNYNSLISDVTFAIEENRPINADVLVKSAIKIKLDLIMNIVIDDKYKNTSTTVVQNVKDKLLAELTTNILTDFVSAVDIKEAAASVTGILRARVVYFNKENGIGTVTKIQAQANEYFEPGNITINIETR